MGRILNNSKISIVTVAAFDRQRLEKTLASLSRVDSPIEYIVVVPTLDLQSQELVSSYSKNFKFPTVLLLDEQAGIYAAMNLALQHATGDFVIYWNAGDSLINPQRLERFVNLEYPAGTQWIIFGANFEWMQSPLIDTESYRKFVNQDKNAYISHQQIAVSRSLLLAMGGFDSRYQIAADFKVIAAFSHYEPYLADDLVLVSVEYPYSSSLKNRRGRIETFQILLTNRPISIIGPMRFILNECVHMIRKFSKIPSR